jgi:hypothetical protein
VCYWQIGYQYIVLGQLNMGITQKALSVEAALSVGKQGLSP